MASSILPGLLTDPLRLLLFGGKGGVGKTTSALATALFRARKAPESRILLVSTDPAHSLRHALGHHPLPENLSLLELDSQACLDRFRAAHGEHFEEIARRGTFLDREDIAQLTQLSLPGMDEVMAILELLELVEARTYDIIVVDTAPTGHTWRLLTVPRLLRRWLQAMDTLLAKHRYMKKLFSGNYQPDAVDHFLLDLSGQLKRLEKLLRDGTRTRFVPVTLAEPLPLAETGRLLELLVQLKMPVQEGIVNRLVPLSACPVCEQLRRTQQPWLAQTLELSRVRWLGIPLKPDEPAEEGLETFFSDASWVEAPQTEVGHLEGPLAEGEADAPPVVWSPPTLPGPQVRMLLFAGKGGVGKTTLACATALRLAHAYPDRQVLLFSTDPAHSVSDCLKQEVGGTRTAILPNLAALEINAEAELKGLKRLYATELEKFLRSTLRNLDLTFDEEVMRQLMELSPPGIDEVMALTVAMDQLEHEQDILVLDAAPTGHLLRLLEMPELLQSWLKTFFSLMLKYKDVLRLPGVTDRLIALSKSLKALRALLRNPERARVVGVSIATQVAIEETIRLKEGCERLGAPLPVLFFNLLTPPAPCALCQSLEAREHRVLSDGQNRLVGLEQAQVMRTSGLVGVAALTRLGEALYRNPAPSAAVSGAAPAPSTGGTA